MFDKIYLLTQHPQFPLFLRREGNRGMGSRNAHIKKSRVAYCIITVINYFLIVLASFFSLKCKESLPVHIVPQHVVDIKITTIEQYNDHIARPGRQKMHIVLSGENVYDEVFWDSVNIKGSVRIWWKRKPQRYKTIILTEKSLTNRALVHNGRMMLVPGQRFSMDMYWDIRSDDGIYLVSEMDFAKFNSRTCAANVICGNREDFVIEASLNIYDRLGYLKAPPEEFTFYPRMCKYPEYPPCGP